MFHLNFVLKKYFQAAAQTDCINHLDYKKKFAISLRIEDY